MEIIFSFLVNASAGIVLFYLVYWFFLRNETFYLANRWYLLAALLSALLLPLFPVRYEVMVDPENSTSVLRTISDTFKHIPVVTDTSTDSFEFNWKQVILIVYITGASIFLLRLLTQTFILIHMMIKYKVKSPDGIRIVENERYGLPFSFFNVIFINPKFHTQENLPEILAHEKVHIRENHWFDLLFIELLTVIFWFNPFIWFFERSIKQNHEYLADKAVLAQGHGVGRYQALLINQLMGMQIIGITNNLNFALSTNRLKMMTKTKTSALRRVKILWAMPAVALLLFAFAEPDYQLKFNEANAESTDFTIQKSEKPLIINGKVILDEGNEPLPGASIVIKGSTIGCVSDMDGSFTLTDPNPMVKNDGSLSSEIVVSFVGLKTVVNTIFASASALNEARYTIKMEEAVQVLHNANYSGEQLPPPPPLSVEEFELKEKLAPPPPPPPAKKSAKSAKEEVLSPPPPPPPAEGQKEVFYVVEDMPKYPGGYYAMQDYIAKMQQKISQSNNVKGKASVSFTVDKNGKVTDIKVVKQDNDASAKGAVMVASGMPDWSPGKQRGKAVRVKYLLPVEFK